MLGILWMTRIGDFSEEQFAKISPFRRSAFFAAVAERLADEYASFAEHDERGNVQLYREILDGVWKIAVAQILDASEYESLYARYKPLGLGMDGEQPPEAIYALDALGWSISSFSNRRVKMSYIAASNYAPLLSNFILSELFNSEELSAGLSPESLTRIRLACQASRTPVDWVAFEGPPEEVPEPVPLPMSFKFEYPDFPADFWDRIDVAARDRERFLQELRAEPEPTVLGFAQAFNQAMRRLGHQLWQRTPDRGLERNEHIAQQIILQGEPTYRRAWRSPESVTEVDEWLSLPDLMNAILEVYREKWNETYP